MKMNKPWIATLAIGGMVALSPALLAADTNTPPAAPPGAPGGPGGPPPRMGRMGPNVDELVKDLNLTDDQKTKVKTALEARQQKMRELFQDSTTSREDKMAKRKTIFEDTDKKLKEAGLTQEQIDKLDRMGPRTRAQRPGGPGGENAGDKAPGDKPAAQD